MLCICEKCRQAAQISLPASCPKCGGEMRKATAIETEWLRRLEDERKAGWR